MKRGIIRLSGAGPIFRVSKPGVDVDLAASNEFVAHESFIFSQPFAFGYVGCPYAGFVGPGIRDQTASVAVPNIGVTPTIHVFADSHESKISFPYQLSEGSGNTANGYNTIQNTITATYSPGLLSVRFVKNSSSRFSLNGCYYMLTRNADA